jgi:hypothetical protein
MLRTTIPAALALACIAAVKPALAQTAVSGFGMPGQFVVSADRMFGLNVWWAKNEPDPTPTNPNPVTTKDSGTAINLLWGGDTRVGTGNTPGGTPNAPVYSMPRVGLDYLIISGLTIGAAVGYLHRGGSRETTLNNVTMSVDTPSVNGLLLYPRVGYIFDFTPLFSVWARGGFTYYWLKSDETTTQGNTIRERKISNDGLALTLDPELVITPIPHFGFTVGPMFDIPMTGGQKNEVTTNGVTVTTNDSAKIFNWGFCAGLLGYF